METKLGENGKINKVPYQLNNKPASTSNSRTWSDFASAWSARDRFDGVGFVLTDSEIAAFDLDDCRDPETGALDPWAQALIDKAGSYTETAEQDRRPHHRPRRRRLSDQQPVPRP